MLCICHYDSPLGAMTLSADHDALTGLWFDGQKYFGAGLTGPYEEKTIPVLADAMRWLDRYFSGAQPGFTPTLYLNTTPFRYAVWKILLTIPYGETMCYGEIAAFLAQRQGFARMSAQAVGGAVSHNPISLIIPCHRVVGADGSLIGYAGGLARKRQLLTLEGVILP